MPEDVETVEVPVAERLDDMMRLLGNLERRVHELERACVHQLESRKLVDAVGGSLMSEHWNDPVRGGSWEGGGT